MKKFFLITLITVSAQILFATPIDTQKQNKKQLKPALVVIDIQNEYLSSIPEGERELGLRRINGAISLFREYDLPVIRIYHTDPKYGPEPDTEPFEFPSSVNIKPEDPKIIKNYPNAFKKTNLDQLLREKDCNTLFLCGQNAVICILATYHGAQDLDYNVFLIEDAIMSHNSDYTDFIEEILRTVRFSTLAFMLQFIY